MEKYEFTGQSFSEVLKEARARRGISQRDLAIAIGKHWTYISKMELEDFPPAAATTVVDMAHVLGIDPDFLCVVAGKIPPDLQELLCSDYIFVRKVREKLKVPVPAHVSEEQEC